MFRQLYFAEHILIGVNFYISPVRRRSLNNLLTSVCQRQGIRLFHFLCQGGRMAHLISLCFLHKIPVTSRVGRSNNFVTGQISSSFSFYWLYRKGMDFFKK